MAEGTSIESAKISPGPGEAIIVKVRGVLSTNETLTVDDLGTIEGWHVVNESDNAVDTMTAATNILTLTESTISDNTYSGIVWGTK